MIVGGLPGSPDFGLEIVVASGGVVYGLFTFGSGGSLGGYATLTSDQKSVLSSLHFIPRSGPLPGQPNRTVASALHGCATVEPAQLSFSDVMNLSPLMLFVDGSYFSPRRAVTVRLSWQGTLIPGRRSRYTTYTVYRIVFPNRDGAIAATLPVPVQEAAFTSFTAHIVATDTRTGHRLATLDQVFKTPSRPL